MVKHYLRLADERWWKVGPKYPGLEKGHVHIGVFFNNLFGSAVKVKKVDRRTMLHNHELRVYDHLMTMSGSNVGIPKVHVAITRKKHSYLILDRLDETLAVKKERCGGSISLKSVLQVGWQGVTRLETIHKAGLLHRRICPRNLMMGRYLLDEGDVYVIDFENAEHFDAAVLRNRYIDAGTKFRQKESKEQYRATAFSSVRQDRGLRGGRRDDLESLAYTLVHLAMGELPWEREDAKRPGRKGWRAAQEMADAKAATSIGDLTRGFPWEFAAFLHYILRLEVDEEPDYDFLWSLLQNVFFREGYEDDVHFAWSDLPVIPLGERPQFLSTAPERKKRNWWFKAGCFKAGWFKAGWLKAGWFKWGKKPAGGGGVEATKSG